MSFLHLISQQISSSWYVVESKRCTGVKVCLESWWKLMHVSDLYGVQNILKTTLNLSFENRKHILTVHLNYYSLIAEAPYPSEIISSRLHSSLKEEIRNGGMPTLVSK